MTKRILARSFRSFTAGAIMLRECLVRISAILFDFKWWFRLQLVLPQSPEANNVISLLSILFPFASIFRDIIFTLELISKVNSGYHSRVEVGRLTFRSFPLYWGSMIINYVSSAVFAQHTSLISLKVLTTGKAIKRASSLYHTESNFLKFLLIEVLEPLLGRAALVIARTRWSSLISGWKTTACKNLIILDVYVN